jgi:hypothetical protein
VLISSPLDLGGVLPWELLPLQLLVFVESAQWGSIPIDVQIFVQIVQDKLEKLFGILLLVDAPLGVEVTTYTLELVSMTFLCKDWIDLP